MKFFLVFSLSILSSGAFALDLGMCKPLKDSKKYINFSHDSGYPKEVEFTCNYQCKGKDGLDKIKGTTKIKLMNSTDDAKRSVCQGVKVKKVSWGWEFDTEKEFYAHLAQTKEVKSWANKTISHFNKIDKSLLAKKKLDLNKVARSYIEVNTPGHKYFKEAGIVLMDIAYHIPENTKLLEKHLKLIEKSPTQNMQTKLGLIQNVLKSHFNFLIP